MSFFLLNFKFYIDNNLLLLILNEVSKYLIFYTFILVFYVLLYSFYIYLYKFVRSYTLGLITRIFDLTFDRVSFF